MLCQFLLYNKVNHLYIYICPHISSLLHLPPFHSPYLTLLCGHKALSLSPYAMQLFPTSYIFYVWQCIYVHSTLSFCPSLLFPLPISTSPFSSRSASLFPSYPQVLHEHFFLHSIYMCQHTVFVFLFLSYFTLYYSLQVHPSHYK